MLAKRFGALYLCTVHWNERGHPHIHEGFITIYSDWKCLFICNFRLKCVWWQSIIIIIIHGIIYSVKVFHYTDSVLRKLQFIIHSTIQECTSFWCPFHSDYVKWKLIINGLNVINPVKSIDLCLPPLFCDAIEQISVNALQFKRFMHPIDFLLIHHD